MLISPEHFELNQKYQKLLLKNMQMEKLIEKKDEEYKLLLSRITPLQNFVEDLTAQFKELQALYEEALKVIRGKDKQIQRLELIEHQYQQLQRLVYARSSEKSPTTPGQLLLELEAEDVEACQITDGRKISSHTRHKAEAKTSRPQPATCTHSSQICGHASGEPAGRCRNVRYHRDRAVGV